MKTRLAIVTAIILIPATISYGTFPKIRLVPVVQGEIAAPVGITHASDGSDRLFIIDQRGLIHVLQNDSILPTPMLDLGSKLISERPVFDERGLLGIAFHPNFGEVGMTGADKFYVYYSAPHPDVRQGNPAAVNPNHRSVVAEYAVTEVGSNVADPTSERILMEFDQPQFNHNGGYLGFGADNLLYISTGDGGGANDNQVGHTGGGPGNPSGVLGNAQDRTNLLGKILRIDVDANDGPTSQYGIPEANPFVGVGGGVREEIFAYGLRNPWRATFDDGPGGDGRLIVADVGQNRVEEINVIEPGGNYGWRVKEGSFDFDNTTIPNPAASLIDPIAEYTRPGTGLPLLEVGISITGGVVYRGSQHPELYGKYIFGDFSTGFQPANGTLLGLEETMPGEFDVTILDVEGGNPIGEYIIAFGLDENGEAYMATRTVLAANGHDMSGMPTGAIYRISVVPEPSIFVQGALLVGCLATLHFLGARRWHFLLSILPSWSASGVAFSCTRAEQAA